MGYGMTQRGDDFFISCASKLLALAVARHVHGHWVKAGDADDCETLESLFEVWGWEAEVDAHGDIVSLTFSSEKRGAEEKLFAAIAPYVRPGSFIEMVGEDGALWRWCFDGKTCTEKEPSVRW